MEIPTGCQRLMALSLRAKEMYDRAGLKRHNWEHVSRNYDRARHILEKESAQVELTLAGVILHDIGYFYGNLQGHAHMGAERCEKLLVELDYRREEVEGIRHCILAHDPASGVLPESIEAKIVYDADMLEKADFALILEGSWVAVAEEFRVTLTEYAEMFIDRYEPLLQEERAYFTDAGRRWDNGNLAVIIDVARRLRNDKKQCGRGDIHEF